MNRLEELLIILSEECAEVQQAASKCIRFGMLAFPPTATNNIASNLISNKSMLEYELGDMMAMMRLVVEESNLDMEAIIAAADAKLIKVEKFMRNSKSVVPAPVEKPHRRGPRRKTR